MNEIQIMLVDYMTIIKNMMLMLTEIVWKYD